MRKISFVATRPKKFMVGSWIIQKCMGTDYSHVAVLFHSSSKKEKFFPYEANSNTGVNFVGQVPWESRNKIVWEKMVDVSDESYNEILDFSMNMCGQKYALWQNIGIKICEWFKIKNNPWTKGKNCSELVKLISDKMGYIIPVDNNQVTPRHAVDTLREVK